MPERGVEPRRRRTWTRSRFANEHYPQVKILLALAAFGAYAGLWLGYDLAFNEDGAEASGDPSSEPAAVTPAGGPGTPDALTPVAPGSPEASRSATPTPTRARTSRSS